MAFTVATFGPIGGQSRKGKSSMWWTYTTTDAIATVNTAAYFNDVSDLVAVGDIIHVFDSNTPTQSLVAVLSNASGVVDVSDGTTISVADAD